MKIKNENDLMQLLKIYASESVRKAKKNLRESSDPAQKNYLKDLKASESHYNTNLTNLKEEEEATPEEEEAVSNSGPEEEVEDAEETIPDAEEFGTSFDGVVKYINNLRAGRSTKDKEIKNELMGYYDNLSEEERKVLQLFLKELSKILQGAIDASDAVDPSDPPLYAQIVLNKGEADSAEPVEQEPEEDEEEKPEGGEDTSPPIKVGGQQNLQEIRKKVRRLMKRF